MRTEAVFLFNLLQDVNILRGLVYLTARETDASLRFLVSASFLQRDQARANIWHREITALAADTGARIQIFDTPAEIRMTLQGGGGVILSASESDLAEHRTTHEAFRVTPSSYLKITLQHGLECVGFLHGRAHVAHHGRNVCFNADVICGWLAPHRLTSLAASERPKLCVTGPPTLLQIPRPGPGHPPQSGGLVCENLQSVRLRTAGTRFLDILLGFCRSLSERGQQVTLRPHPGGQLGHRSKHDLPPNVVLNPLPIYHVNMPGYQYGISPPSTVVLDMVLANIPVAIWQDPGGGLDISNYDGLTTIRRVEDWLAFERDTTLRPGMLLTHQRRFLDRLEMPTDPAEIYRRFARLIVNALALRSERVGS